MWKCTEPDCEFNLCQPKRREASWRHFKASQAAHAGHHSRNSIKPTKQGDGVGEDEKCGNVWGDDEFASAYQGDGSGHAEFCFEGTEIVTEVEEHANFNVVYVEPDLKAALNQQEVDDYWEDFFDQESIIDELPLDVETNPGAAVEVATETDLTIFKHQQIMQEVLQNPLKGTRGSKNVAATLDLFALGLSLDVSIAKGDELLHLFNKYSSLPEEGEERSQSMFKTWQGLKTAVGRRVKEACILRCLSVPLPEEFFGHKDLRGKDLKGTKCWHYSLLERLGQALLDVKPEHFCKKPRIETIRGSIDRVYSDFSTGLLFERISILNTDVYGDGVCAVVLGFFYDEANAAANGSRSACPLVMFILNVIHESFKPIFLGMCPLDLPYTHAYLRKVGKAP